MTTVKLTRREGHYGYTSPSGERFEVSCSWTDVGTRLWTADGDRGNCFERESLSEIREALGTLAAPPTSHPMRVTMYAAFSGDGTPALNVWDFDAKRLATRIGDRIANGEALSGEHSARVTVSMYNRLMRKRGWPEVTR